MKNSPEDWEARLLQHVARPGYEPAKPRVIAKRLGLSEDDVPQLRRLVKRLVRRGQLAFGPKHQVLPPAAGRDGAAAAGAAAGAAGAGATAGTGATDGAAAGGKTVTGTFQRAAGGYGFIRPAGTARAAGRDDDIYVPAEATRDAADGDTVLARVKTRRRGNALRRVGEILEVVSRRTEQFVGTYFEEHDQGYVRVDGSVFQQPLFVGDPGAKNAHPDDKVVVEIVSFPHAGRQGEAVITEVLGQHGQAGVDTLLIIREFSLPDAFPEPVLEAARQVAQRFDDTDISGRLDLTNTTVITIDPADARDFDDAISLERIEEGHWRLGVHIADVAHFVPPGTVLDQEARERGTSVYLPDRVIPMLPEIISNNLASLQPERVRFARSCFIEFTPHGARVDTQARASAIKSARRFTYEEVDSYLADPQAWRKKLTPAVHRLLGEMHELAMILRHRRLEQGAIELSMREVKIDLDKRGRVAGAHTVEHTASHQMIEEFMLAANNAIAEMLRDRGLDFLRRVHESPDPRKLKALTQFAQHLGFDVESLESRFEIKRLLARVLDRPEEYAVNYAVLRSFQKAVYSPDATGHYALASDCYCHFTSPIRRYPDLTVHRMLAALEAGKRPAGDVERLARLGEHCSDREQRAEKAERELVKLKLLDFMRQRLGHRMQAVITGVESFGFFVLGLEIPAEGLVPIESLQDDYYDYDDRVHAIVGRRAGTAFSLGDVVEVEVDQVDMTRRELDLKFVRHVTVRQAAEASPSPRPARRASGRPAGPQETKPPRPRGAKRGTKSAPHKRRKK